MRFALFSIVVLVLAAVACGRPAPGLEQRAQRLESQIICPVCPGETLDQSQVQVARDMKVVIRERLAAGESEEEIRDYFVDRYGTRILAQPPTSGISLAVWIVPPVAFVAASIALYLVVREMRRRRQLPGTALPGASDAGLAPYLKKVDEEISRNRNDRS